MIVCKECGNSAPSADGFCSSCGALLEWSGQPVEATAAVADSGRSPSARQPAAERARLEPVPLVTEPVLVGPYCSACGVRNPEDRAFCRSCGGVLREGTIGPERRLGWWGSLLARLRRRRSYQAGDRPRGFLAHDAIAGQAAAAAAAPTVNGPRLGPPATGTRSPGALVGTAGQRVRRVNPPKRLALRRYAPLLVAVALLAVGLGPARTSIIDRVRSIIALGHQQYETVASTGATASSWAPGHPGELAVDGIDQTYWLTGAGAGTGASLTIRFAGPKKIDEVGVLSGEPGGDDLTQARPQKLEFIAHGNQPVSLTLKETPGYQSYRVNLRHVTFLTVVIKSAYAGQEGQAVALRELEFFTLV